MTSQANSGHIKGTQTMASHSKGLTMVLKAQYHISGYTQRIISQVRRNKLTSNQEGNKSRERESV